jgi:DNA-binding CsgD family transcriptional regulator
MEIREILRRSRTGESDRAIVRLLKISRKTVEHYHYWADERGC